MAKIVLYLSKMHGEKIKNEGRTTGTWGTYWKEPQTSQEKIPWKHMWRVNGISKNRIFWFNVNGDEGTELERKP